MQRLPWRDPFSVALALCDEPGLVLLESGAGFGDVGWRSGRRSGRRSFLSVRPQEVVREGLHQLDGIEHGLWAGWLSYDLGREVERVPSLALDDRGLPPLALGRYGSWIEFDHVRRELCVHGEGLQRADLLAAVRDPRDASPVHREPGEWTSSLPRAYYEHVAREVIDYIRAGDVFQANVSQRLSAGWDGDPFALYGSARAMAPAPFMGLVRLCGADVVSASPELFLRRHGRRIETRPIKGTRPRGRDAREDAALAAQLRSSGKDRAENVMIVDLARNDLGRVCEYGSVRVERLHAVESHAGVHQLVSTVAGELRAGVDVADLVRATFPPGSVTGAPKIRAIEIIEELEPVRRGPYCGSLVWIEPGGDLCMSVAIRTFVAAGGVLDLHAGGAIVADSDPHAEWRESMHKAAPLLAAAGGELPIELRLERPVATAAR